MKSSKSSINLKSDIFTCLSGFLEFVSVIIYSDPTLKAQNGEFSREIAVEFARFDFTIEYNAESYAKKNLVSLKNLRFDADSGNNLESGCSCVSFV
ncbi:MAG: hypothetical protein EAZ60_21085 [Oscillatoriales cyanobacterium]|nr:MAG: hypothetical protein EAZ83_16070 [Oscillatoriales cyanobacterium]TAE99135.1 MAG: hypothetical protein EAZ79_05815 [Oscillatoriales cyanobacterium]TAF18651.1 MAG: hypothetical protein EAZ73_17500 [Oscillatoriales cyanobacterium]TAF33385.1 MAG: hypothetical protein EAZ69_16250 [Oscillatoriales cyanobacterium]TAF53209.1 MAG: hypothetical protein EAZ60_21085 [Oscillatoriales cyanobacterium]